MNVANFDRQARAAHRKVVAEATESIRSVALSAYEDLQADVKAAGDHGSPVASGRYASSIRVGINAIDTSTAPADPQYVYERPLNPRTINNNPVSRIAALLRTFKLGDTIYLSNSVPYARKIEVGRHSWQAPEGVFEPTFRRLIARFRSLNLRVKRV